MTSHQPDRRIPHVRDIFGDYRTNSDHSFSKFSSIRVGEKDDEGSKECSDEEHYEYRGYSSDEASKKSSCSNHAQNDQYNHPSNNSNQEDGGKRVKEQFNNYRTLTEKDLRHIERHLSMKKTIRKQLSRHLSQACVENMDPYGDNGGKVILADRDENDRLNLNVMALSMSSKSAKSETNFMAMLKTGVRNQGGDSGHSSPTLEAENRLISRRSTKELWEDDVLSQASPTQENNMAANPESSKKRSFWQKLTKRNKNAR